MIISILDENLKKIDILRKYDFAQYEDPFRDIGEFKVNAQVTDENLYLVDKNKEFYLLFDGVIVGKPVLGKVESVKKSSDNEFDNTMEITGRLAPVIFRKRVIAETINFSGKTCDLVGTIIDSEMIHSSNAKRNMNIDLLYDGGQEKLRTYCSNVDKQITGGYVWDEIQTLLEQDNLGVYFDPVVVPGEDTNITQYTLLISRGADHRKGNSEGNKAVIFSQDLSNIARTDYRTDSENYCNVAYVAGEGEGESRKWYEVFRTGEESKSGWGRNELWVDARDIQSGDPDGSNPISEEEYEKLIKQRANEKFAENQKNETFSSTVTDHDKRYKYGVDYKKGDYVTVIDTELGITVDAQITSVTYSVQNSEEIIDIELTYGTIRKDPVKEIKNTKNNVMRNQSDIKYLETKIQSVTKQNRFLTFENYSDIITVGNLMGGTLVGISGVKVGNVITLFFQINDITDPVADTEIFQFKESRYFPIDYGAYMVYVSRAGNVAYAGRFTDGHFTLSIGGGGVDSENPVTVLGTLVYIAGQEG